jgi:hypothetical protein
VFRVLKILHRKYSQNIPQKFPGKFFIRKGMRPNESSRRPPGSK